MGEQEIEDEIGRVGSELDHARASYGRACAWTWPYFNLKPLCKAPGFEAATIRGPMSKAPVIDPATILKIFLPVPVIRLSEASPDYKEIRLSLDYWEPKTQYGQIRLKDLNDDRKSAAAAWAALAAGPDGKPLDPKDPPEDSRLAQMLKLYQQLKPVLKRWRTAQYEIEDLAEPWYNAKDALATLQNQTQNIQQQIVLLALQARDPNQDQMQIQNQVQALQNQLAALMPQIVKARVELEAIETKVATIRQEQAGLALKTEESMESWIDLCDIPGKRGPEAHQKSLPLYNRWIAEEPRLWQLYLARGLARLHSGNKDQAAEAIGDLKRVDVKLHIYDTRPIAIAFGKAVQAYALCKQNNMREGIKMFNEAKKMDKTISKLGTSWKEGNIPWPKRISN